MIVGLKKVSLNDNEHKIKVCRANLIPTYEHDAQTDSFYEGPPKVMHLEGVGWLRSGEIVDDQEMRKWKWGVVNVHASEENGDCISGVINMYSRG